MTASGQKNMKDEYDLKSMKQRPKREFDPEAFMIPINLKIHANKAYAIRDEADRLGIPYLKLIEKVINQNTNGFS
jgi:predicted DNA binding CopG/RHH family protein